MISLYSDGAGIELILEPHIFSIKFSDIFDWFEV